MAQQHYLKAGLVNNYSGTQNKQAPIVGFHLERWLKRALKAYNVTTFDNCCNTDQDPQPLRYNPDTGSIEAWDGMNWNVVGTGGGTALPPPDNFAGTQDSGRTVLTWDPVPGASGYVLRKDGIVIYNGPLTTFTATGLTNDVPYIFSVATKSTGNPNSAPVFITVTPHALINPVGPTSQIVDDVLDTYDWTNDPSYPNLGDYEYTMDGGLTYAILATKPLIVGPIALPNGKVGVRVKAVPGISNASATLYNTNPYTVPAITARWMSQAADPHPDLSTNNDPFTYTGSAVLPSNSANIIADLHDAAIYPDNDFFVFKVPSGVTDKTLWTDDLTNAPFNAGTIPDSIFRDMVSFGGFDYYYTRVGQIWDHTPGSVVTLS